LPNGAAAVLQSPSPPPRERGTGTDSAGSNGRRQERGIFLSLDAKHSASEETTLYTHIYEAAFKSF